MKKDKILHITVSMGIVLLAIPLYWTLQIVLRSVNQCLLVNFANSLCIVGSLGSGLWKEYIHDKKHGKGHFSAGDLGADMVGIGLGVVVNFIVLIIFL